MTGLYGVNFFVVLDPAPEPSSKAEVLARDYQLADNCPLIAALEQPILLMLLTNYRFKKSLLDILD